MKRLFLLRKMVARLTAKVSCGYTAQANATRIQGFCGTVLTDAFSVYDKLDRENPDITFAGCWAHGRRRFTEAIQALPKNKKEAAKETVAYQALEQIAAIYHLDNKLSGLTSEERRKARQLTVKPLVEAYFAWAKEVLKSKTLEGLNYCVNHEKALTEFLDDGDLPLDNNATETAKANRLNPFRYLEFLLTELMEHQDDTNRNFLKELLPWSENLPDICRVKSKV